MSYSDEEKRAFCIAKIVEHLNTLDTWTKFKTFINGITKAKLKALLKQAFIDAQASGDLVISSAQEKKANDAEMASEIEGLF